MQLARIAGHATSTVKRASLTGWRLLIAQPLRGDNAHEGDPLLVIDKLGAAPGDSVMISNDGQAAREMVGAKDSPVRWFVMGICD